MNDKLICVVIRLCVFYVSMSMTMIKTFRNENKNYKKSILHRRSKAKEEETNKLVDGRE